MDTSDDKHAEDPQTLAYATPDPARLERWRRVLRRTTLVAIISIAVILIELSLDFGSQVDSCAACGAVRHARHFYLFGLGGRYDNQVTEGPVSRFIQAQSGVPCTHQWELASRTSGGVVLGVQADGWGGTRISEVHRLEMFDACEQFLLDKAKTDPAFLGRLKTAVRRARSGSGTFLQATSEELFGFTTSKLGP